jgi:hypothetical protein
MEATVANPYSQKWPWTDYNTKEHRHTSGQDVSNYSVTWYMSTTAPGMHGWRTEVRSFKTKEDAMAAGERLMGVAFEVVVYEWDWTKPHNSKERRKTLYTRKRNKVGKYHK